MNLFAFSADEALDTAERYGTPCFAYRLGAVEARYRRLRAALPGRCVLAYAVKANPGEPLLALLSGLGASFDCASAGELHRVLATGASGGRALFAGPGKSDEDIGAALAAGARLQVDGPEDIERIDALIGAAAPDSRIDVNLRVHPLSGIVEGSRIIGGTGPSAFGVDEEDLGAFMASAAAYPRVRIAGLQVFAASNERDFRRLLANHRATMAIARRLAEDYGLPMDIVDLGGGLGIPYAEGEEELDVEALGAGLRALLEENPWFKGGLILEPGRWLAGPCGVYLARVARTKSSRGEAFAILEGGINHLLRPLLTGQAFPALAPGSYGEELPQTLAGPLCTSLDRLGSVSLPELERGGLVMLGQTGAYGYTESMGDFLMRPRPTEVWLP